MKRAFEVKQKAFFIIFNRFSIAKDCLRPESTPLIYKSYAATVIFPDIMENIK